MNEKLISFLILLITMVISGHGFSASLSCPEPASRGDAKIKSFRTFLKKNQISIVSQSIKTNELQDFIFEYNKFPLVLRKEMIEAGIKIHLIDGTGVAQDPTWYHDPKTQDEEFDARESTFDGRNWNEVPGSGGAALSEAKIPTRLVLNKLYDDHGSVNLVLHEHAHSLDSMYQLRNISNSRAWQEIISIERVKNFAREICGSYCTENAEESFAELFAYYYACSATRNQLKSEAPEAAAFIKNLRSIKKLNLAP